MIASVGVLTSRGGRTSHAAVVARGMGRPCVSGAEGLEVDAVARTARAGDVEIREGDLISLDGSTGEVFVGPVPLAPSPVRQYLEFGVDAAVLDLEGDEDAAGSVCAVDRMLRHADTVRRLEVRQRRYRRRCRPGPATGGSWGRPLSDRAHVPGGPPSADRETGPG